MRSFKSIKIFDTYVIPSDYLSRCLSCFFLHKWFEDNILHCVKLTDTNMAHPKKRESIYIVATYEFRGKTSPTRIQCVKLRLIEPIRYTFLVSIDWSDAIRPIARFRRIARFFEYLLRKVLRLETKTSHYK